MGEYWRYRVGDIRVICDIEDGQMMVLVIEISDRREVYRWAISLTASSWWYVPKLQLSQFKPLYIEPKAYAKKLSCVLGFIEPPKWIWRLCRSKSFGSSRATTVDLRGAKGISWVRAGDKRSSNWWSKNGWSSLDCGVFGVGGSSHANLFYKTNYPKSLIYIKWLIKTLVH